MSGLRVDHRGVLVPCESCGRTNRLAFAHLDKSGRCASCKTALPPPSSPVEVPDSATFDRLVASTPVPVVVDYWAPWCGPCRMVAPELEKLARARQGQWLVAKVNTDLLSDLAARFDIRSIPTLGVFFEGHEVTRSAGARPATEIDAFVTHALRSR